MQGVKAYYIKSIGEVPPKTHNIVYLADKAQLTEDIDEDLLNFLYYVSPLNIEARYPKYKNEIAKKLNKKVCENILSKTKDIYKWVKKKL